MLANGLGQIAEGAEAGCARPNHLYEIKAEP
jgi:hypothetical protein